MKRLIQIGGVLLIIAVGLLIYFFNDPTSTPWMPKCVWLSLTGYKCPGCGTQRFLYHFFNGEFREAIGYNPLMLIELPLFIAYALGFMLKGTRVSRWIDNYLAHIIVGEVFMVIAIIWTIVRNIWDL